MKWLRLYTDIRSDAKVGLLAFEDQRHYIWLLTMMLDGTLDQFQGDMLDRAVGRQLGLDASTTSEVKRRLMEVMLVDHHWRPIGWKKRQYESDSSAERTRKWRENKKKTDSNVTVTSQGRFSDGPDTDTDTEKDIDHGHAKGATDTTFDQFWEAYPRKVAKKKAQSAWRTEKCHRCLNVILEDIARRRSNGWADPKFIPHPATYLNQRRWEDEQDEPTQATPRNWI
jgi:hypothetical protein